MAVEPQQTGRTPYQSGFTSGPATTNLGDILERVLDKGLVIAGDIRINLLDIELLTVKLRLLIASVDTARQLGIDWWEHDPWLTSAARRGEFDGHRRADAVTAGEVSREVAGSMEERERPSRRASGPGDRDE